MVLCAALKCFHQDLFTSWTSITYPSLEPNCWSVSLFSFIHLSASPRIKGGGGDLDSF